MRNQPSGEQHAPMHYGRGNPTARGRGYQGRGRGPRQGTACAMEADSTCPTSSTS